MFGTFFRGSANHFSSSRSVAKGIKLYYDTFRPNYRSKLIPFVTYIPIEALAMCFAAVSPLHKYLVSVVDICFAQLKRTLDLRKHGIYQNIPFDEKNYSACYESIRDALYARARSDRAWTKKYLIDSCRAYVVLPSQLQYPDDFPASLQASVSFDWWSMSQLMQTIEST